MIPYTTLEQFLESLKGVLLSRSAQGLGSGFRVEQSRFIFFVGPLLQDSGRFRV